MVQSVRSSRQFGFTGAEVGRGERGQFTAFPVPAVGERAFLDSLCVVRAVALVGPDQLSWVGRKGEGNFFPHTRA